LVSAGFRRITFQNNQVTIHHARKSNTVDLRL
jgi:hypothetical protein